MGHHLRSGRVRFDEQRERSADSSCDSAFGDTVPPQSNLLATVSGHYSSRDQEGDLGRALVPGRTADRSGWSGKAPERDSRGPIDTRQAQATELLQIHIPIYFLLFLVCKYTAHALIDLT
jgi:hypothetical protein